MNAHIKVFTDMLNMAKRLLRDLNGDGEIDQYELLHLSRGEKCPAVFFLESLVFCRSFRCDGKYLR